MARITDMNGNPLSTYELHRAAYRWWALKGDGYWARERAWQKLAELEAWHIDSLRESADCEEARDEA